MVAIDKSKVERFSLIAHARKVNSVLQTEEFFRFFYESNSNQISIATSFN